MSADFQFDVFLSHSAKDKPVVRPLAERLRGDGLRVWFDEWMLKPGDSIPAKIEEGLEHSPLGFQPSAFSLQPLPGAPLNQERRFIPLRLDDESQFTQPDVLKLPPISHHGNVNEIIGNFGGADQSDEVVLMNCVVTLAA